MFLITYLIMVFFFERYPFGRFVGGTVYPGLMWTAFALFNFLKEILPTSVNIRDVCVLLSPFMASNTSVVVYFLTKNCWDRPAALVAAAFMAIAPGYISRSVAGSFDNEVLLVFLYRLKFAFSGGGDFRLIAHFLLVGKSGEFRNTILGYCMCIWLRLYGRFVGFLFFLLDNLLNS